MQLYLETGLTLDEVAIELIRAYEPPSGYYLGFSGGKDSVVIDHLAQMAGVKYQAVYNVSPIDPPLIPRFIKLAYPHVKFENNARNFWNKHFMSNGYPTRIRRWCCRLIKEAGGDGKVKILGMRRQEGNGRHSYDCFMETRRGETWVLPIVGWSDADVWQYISEHNLQVSAYYQHGLQRIGCVLCPYSGKADRRLARLMFPEIVNLWKRAGERYVQERNTNPKRKPIPFSNGEQYFNDWQSK